MQMKSWIRFFALFPLLISVLVPTTGWAEFRVAPSLLVGEEYNDNIYLDAEDEESDFITTINPSLNFYWSTRLVDLNLDWGLRFRYYLKNSEENEDSLDQAQRARLDARFNLMHEVLFLDISDTYERVTIDESEKGAIGNDLVNLTDSNTLRINPYLQLQPWRTVITRLDYIYENVWYDDPEGIDSNTHTASLTVSKELTGKMTGRITGSHTIYRPKSREERYIDDIDDAQDYDRNDATVGLTYRVTERLTLDGHYGKAWIEYKNVDDPILGSGGGGDLSNGDITVDSLNDFDDQDLDLWGINARYQLTEEVSFGGGYNVTTDHTVSEGMIKTEGVDAFLQYARRNRIALRAHATTDDYLTQDREDDSWGMELDGDIPWTNRMGFDYQLAYTDYDNKDPIEGDEQYKRYGLRFGLYRDMKLGRFRIGYTYNKNVSDEDDDTNNIVYDGDNNDYTNNIVYVEMRFTF
jgi:hypothetical protein